MTRSRKAKHRPGIEHAENLEAGKSEQMVLKSGQEIHRDRCDTVHLKGPGRGCKGKEISFEKWLRESLTVDQGQRKSRGGGYRERPK